MLFKRRLHILLILLLCYLQYAFWFGKNNYFDYQKNRDIVIQLTKENNQLKMRNEQMFAEISDLYQGMAAVEERARNHLGMIKPDEHFYRIVNESMPSR